MGSRTPSLPTALTTFVGRQSEISEAASLLETARLLTLTGAGGIGKTRLALEAAAVSARRFPGGVWLVDLTAVQEPSAVPSVTAKVLGVPDLGTRNLSEQMVEFLRERRALILLDNCEHVSEACAELVTAILSTAPDVRVLATSRRTLGLTGEHVFTVPPLPPEEAVDLLRDRATAVRPAFQADDRNRRQMARLCADLDGLPLAIELAASRLRAFTVKQVAERLEDRFALLAGGCSTRQPHQRTLRGTLDWSHDLCTPAERLLWSRLSVFVGGFDLEAAETVCAREGIEGHEVLDLLDQLVAQSVVLTYEVDDMPRYRLLETIRQYGRERLAESGEEERRLLRHRAFFLDLAQRVKRHWAGPDQVEYLAHLRAEHANLLAALDCDADPQTRLLLATALTWHWSAGGFLSEGRQQFERALAAAPEPTTARAHALITATRLAQTQGDLAAADRWLEEAEALSEQLQDPVLQAQVHGFGGISAHYRGRHAEGILRYEQAEARLMALGDAYQASGWLLALACTQAYAGDPRAAETGRRVISACEAQGERWNRAQVLLALGHNSWVRGDRQATRTLAVSALKSMRGFNDHAMVARMVELLAWITAADGDHERAARLLGTADALWRRAGTNIQAFGPDIAEQHARCKAASLGFLGPEAYTRALDEGARHDTPALAIRHALEPCPETPVAPAHPSPLTQREQEVAALIARGLTNRQIATEMVVSPRTVDRHVENIRAKLDLTRRTRIATWWLANQELPVAAG